MTEIKCKTCKHYQFYKMITEGAYSYSGVIPCLTCQEFNKPQNNYEPIAGPIPELPREYDGDKLDIVRIDPEKRAFVQAIQLAINDLRKRQDEIIHYLKGKSE